MSIFERERQIFFHTYKRIELEIDRGEGVYLFDKSGKRYLDLFAGLGVNALGYAHPEVLQAIADQSKRFTHLSNYFVSDSSLAFAELLAKHSGYSKVFLTNSGTEGIEGAIKMARKWGSSRKKKTLLSFDNAFHGRTYGALSLMNREKYKTGFQPFLPDFTILPFNDPSALAEAVTPETLAVVLEFVQGEGGIVPAETPFVEAIVRLKRQYGYLLIADEIQSGIGRTGKPFGFNHFNVQPEIVVAAKPLGGGLPLGAILGSRTMEDVLDVGQHGSTFGGNPVACAAGIVVLREVFEKGLMENAAKMGSHFLGDLTKLQSEYPALIRTVRGMGLMIGIELTRPCDAFVAELRRRGILANCTNQNVVRLIPPLIITGEHVAEGVDGIAAVCRMFNNKL